MIRFTITFYGSVQGVGFRYTTVNISAGYDVLGYVQNQIDGTVLCVAEGEKAELDRFVTAIKNAMHDHLSNTTVMISPATGEFKTFSIH